MPRYKNKSLETVFVALLEAAKNPGSELYYNGEHHRGASHRCAFWDGFDGVTRSANVVPGTMSAAAFQAGKEWARRSNAAANIATKPTPAELKTARNATGLSQTAAAAIVHSTCRAWQQWEAGDRAMHPAFWELFRIKTAAHIVQ